MSSSDLITITLSRLQWAEIYYAALAGYMDMTDANYTLENALSIVENAIDRDREPERN